MQTLAAGQTPRQTFEDGLIDNAVIDAAYRSMKSRVWERVDLSALDVHSCPQPEEAASWLSPRRPNLVFILTDDHASHAISAYGSVVNQTPRIDELARGGALFKNCFATNSLCTPSRASILTGTYSHINGVRTLVTPIDASQPTFISQLKAAGYRTRHGRQVAHGRWPRPRPAALRSLGRADRAGRVPRPPLPQQRRAAHRARLRHRCDHRPGVAVGGRSAGRRSVVRADLAQGAAPPLAAAPASRRSVQGPDRPAPAPGTTTTPPARHQPAVPPCALPST